MRVATVQMKFGPTIDANLAAILRLARRAARNKADVVLFPECAITGYGYDFGSLVAAELMDALQRLGQIAANLHIHLLVGSPVFRGRKLYNCLVAFNRHGRVAYCYAKNHLTPSDKRHFEPGNAIALFHIDRIPVTTIICHERRYPELVRLAVMAGAKIVFHPNAGMDTLGVSRSKRNGHDGIAVRAFENAVYYVFANSVGPQGAGKWSAGDSKIVAPNGRVLKLADNENEAVLAAPLDLAAASRVYARRAVKRPRFLADHWREAVRRVRNQAATAGVDFDLP